jgi:hypothetical protein
MASSTSSHCYHWPWGTCAQISSSGKMQCFVAGCFHQDFGLLHLCSVGDVQWGLGFRLNVRWWPGNSGHIGVFMTECVVLQITMSAVREWAASQGEEMHKVSLVLCRSDGQITSLSLQNLARCIYFWILENTSLKPPNCLKFWEGG